MLSPNPSPDDIDLTNPHADASDQHRVDTTSALSSSHLQFYLLGLLTATVLFGLALWVLRRPEPPPMVLQAPPTPAPTATPTPPPTPAPMTVFVSGAVRQPGLYELPPDARVGDAITLAGGLTDQADGALVNQATPLWDGAQVHVPDATAPAEAVAAAPPAGISGASVPVPALAGGGAAATGGQVNINTAGASELETLPGIGPSKAAAIIENRPYSSVDDLTRVPGIGEKTVDQLRDLVVVQ